MSAPKKNSRQLLPAALALLLSVAAAALLLKPAPPPEPELEPDPHVTVYDGVREISILPAEDVAVNTYTAADFTPAGGYLSCEGGRMGIDVSAYQKNIDWQAAANSGIEFAFLRCGYRGCSAGTIREDSCFRANLRGVESAGLDWGVYFFSQALDEQEAVEEAEYVLSLLGGRVPTLPVMFDWEVVEMEGSRSYGQGDLSARADAFCKRLEKAGVPAGIYCSVQQGYHQYDIRVLDRHALWLACPGTTAPAFYYAADYWQYSFTGSVPGIVGDVDLDLWLPEKP